MSEKIDVVFAMSPAKNKKKRKGMFVTATGGPGVSGLLSADSYIEAFDPIIPEIFDVVFFDQRGIGKSGGFQCPDAVVKFYRNDADPSTPQGEQATKDAARMFANECASILSGLAGGADRLRYYGTKQAIEDLETFRKMVGDEKIWLYGESYGTQFSQHYAAAHPDRVAALVLDGTVDLTLPIQRYMKQQAKAFDDVLRRTLEACISDRHCARDMGGDSFRAYDELAARLKQSHVQVKFPLPDGNTATRAFSATDLETTATGYMYSESDRMMFLRALADAKRTGDLVMLYRLLYVLLVVDPQTEKPILNFDYSDAAYYGVECNDYVYFDGAADERAEKYVRFGDRVDEQFLRTPGIYYGDLPCVFWPAFDSPLPYNETPARDVQTLVLGATADPATPFHQGLDVWRRLNQAWFVEQKDGPHVIFGRGVACVDHLVTAFLVEGKTPSDKRTKCDGQISDDYAQLSKDDARDFENVLEALESAETEINYLPEYYYWDGTTKTSVGCPHGDTLIFDSGKKNTRFALNACAFAKGFRMTGSGSYNADKDRFVLEVDVSGYKSGSLKYVRVGENIRVTGIYGGQKINLMK
jgi:pimeloyl-ACP methyl ester carboxylesterase